MCIIWPVPFSSSICYDSSRTVSFLLLWHYCRHPRCLGLSPSSSCHVASLACSFLSTYPFFSLMMTRTGWGVGVGRVGGRVGAPSSMWLFIQLTWLLLYVLKCVTFLNASACFLPNFCDVTKRAVSPGEHKPLMLILLTRDFVSCVRADCHNLPLWMPDMLQ